jgi:hypothetical protein
MPDDGSSTPKRAGKAGRPRRSPGDRPAAAGTVAEDFRSTGESIQADARRLVAIEADKLARDPADPQIERLSDDAIDLARRLEHETRVERQLSEQLG